MGKCSSEVRSPLIGLSNDTKQIKKVIKDLNLFNWLFKTVELSSITTSKKLMLLV